MKNLTALLAISLSFNSVQLFAQEVQDDIIGIWDAGERNVEIHRVDDRYIGNPIDTLGVRRDEVELLNLEYDDGKWKGNIYSIKRDKLLKVECRIDDQEMNLRVRSGLVRRTLTWTRVE